MKVYRVVGDEELHNLKLNYFSPPMGIWQGEELESETSTDKKTEATNSKHFYLDFYDAVRFVRAREKTNFCERYDKCGIVEFDIPEELLRKYLKVACYKDYNVESPYKAIEFDIDYEDLFNFLNREGKTYTESSNEEDREKEKQRLEGRGIKVKDLKSGDYQGVFLTNSIRRVYDSFSPEIAIATAQLDKEYISSKNQETVGRILELMEPECENPYFYQRKITDKNRDQIWCEITNLSKTYSSLGYMPTSDKEPEILTHAYQKDTCINFLDGKKQHGLSKRQIPLFLQIYYKEKGNVNSELFRKYVDSKFEECVRQNDRIIDLIDNYYNSVNLLLAVQLFGCVVINDKEKTIIKAQDIRGLPSAKIPAKYGDYIYLTIPRLFEINGDLHEVLDENRNLNPLLKKLDIDIGEDNIKEDAS